MLSISYFREATLCSCPVLYMWPVPSNSLTFFHPDSQYHPSGFVTGFLFGDRFKEK